MTTYAIGNLRDVRMGPDIVGYLERIDATLRPFGGRFLVHGGPVETLEGDWQGALVVIAFPDRASATGWYGSPAYREILPLRTNNATTDVILVDDVGPAHKATDVLG
ncbi:DUF1330 domain-containing protein [uncultured Alsobacter sp.]|uniref:DUF1330 domain-containing protein n=1 Tax=uncultured Alsobacter sp. TaxID=1748258 RepID=UPI0025EC30B5|nr:DUF1330 domain-containing protein [uncultured Alsobacter sp.]